MHYSIINIYIYYIVLIGLLTILLNVIVIHINNYCYDCIKSWLYTIPNNNIDFNIELITCRYKITFTFNVS